MKVYTILFRDEDEDEVHVLRDAYLSMDEAIAAANEDWESNWGKEFALSWLLNVGSNGGSISYRVDEISVKKSLAKQQRAAAKKKGK